MSSSAVKLFTLVIPVASDGGRVLLGKKLRGFGEGFWNGFGGKVDRGETILEAAVRELHEECSLQVAAKKLIHRGILTFVWDDQLDSLPWEVHVFAARTFTGTPKASEEMEPHWFSTNELPFDLMWADDKHWYPLFLDAEEPLFQGTFHFVETTKLVTFTLNKVDVLTPSAATLANSRSTAEQSAHFVKVL